MERPMKHTGIALVCAIRSEQQRRLARHRASRPRLACWPSRRRPAGDSSILGDNPGCHLPSASDVKNAVGKDLPWLLGNVSNGQAWNTGHESCTYIANETGKGAAVNLEIDTFPGSAKQQLSTFRSGQQDQVDSENQIQAGSATLKDVSVGDGDFEADLHANGVDDEDVWFTKGDKVVNVEVDSGVRGGAPQLAQEIAGKI